MARRTTLDRLLIDLRVACRISLNAAHNAQHRDAQVQALQAKQEFFWSDFAWPHLRVDRYLDLQAGQRFYSMPDDLDIDRISHISVRMDSVYQLLQPGIDECHYAAYDSELDQRSWPVRRWRISEDEQLEIWPIPDANFDATNLEGRIKITGIRNLEALNAGSDRADLDDMLLVKSCAADYLAATGAKDAQLKLDEANRLYVKLRGALMPRKKFTVGVGTERDRIRKVPIAVYNKTG
jgi:hypothetical protein